MKNRIAFHVIHLLYHDADNPENDVYWRRRFLSLAAAIENAEMSSKEQPDRLIKVCISIPFIGNKLVGIAPGNGKGFYYSQDFLDWRINPIEYFSIPIYNS